MAVGDEAMCCVAESLTSLDLSEYNLGPLHSIHYEENALDEVRNLPWPCVVTDSGLSALTRLQKLRLFDNHHITNESLTKLSHCLIELSLASIPMITDAALSCMTNLTSLDLYENPNITDAGLSVLTKLVYLGLEGNVVIEDDALLLLTRLENADVSYNWYEFVFLLFFYYFVFHRFLSDRSFSRNISNEAVLRLPNLTNCTLRGRADPIELPWSRLVGLGSKLHQYLTPVQNKLIY
jgi:hypothetical protein